MRTFSFWLLISVLTAFVVAACSGAPEPVRKVWEQDDLQTAIDSMMVDKGISGVAASAVSTNSWSDNPTGPSTAPLYPTYLQAPLTDCFYCWDSAGRVTRQDKSSAACGRPAAGSFAEPLCVAEPSERGIDTYFNLNPFWNFYTPVAILWAGVLGVLVGAFWWAKRRP